MVDIVFTIGSRNYMAQALSLMASVGAADPQVHRMVIVSDGVPENDFAAPTGVEFRSGDEFCDEFDQMAAYYSALEFNTALKPFVLRTLLMRQDVSTVVYLDPDILVFSPLTLIRSALETSEIALTPHLRQPLPGPLAPNDHTILRAGVYNLGFIGLKSSTATIAFAAWWAEQCHFDCRVAPEEGLFTDQRWVDLAPGFFDHIAILRSPTLNLAYWNLPEVELSHRGDQWEVDGQPLVFFHFSGFDPNRPDLLSHHQNRIVVEKTSALAALLSQYATILLEHGYRHWSSHRYGFDRFSDGRRVTPLMRHSMLKQARQGYGVRLNAESSSNLDVIDQSWEQQGLPSVTTLMVQFWEETKDRELHLARSKALGRLALHAAFQKHGFAAGADVRSLEAARRLVAQSPRSIELEGLDRAKGSELPRESTLSPQMLAHCVGRLALQGRFDPAELSPTDWRLLLSERSSTICKWTEHAGMVHAATMDDGMADIYLAFGLSETAHWPPEIGLRLRTPLAKPGRIWLGGTLPRFLDTIWGQRVDLQRTFDLRRLSGRLGFVQWFVSNGITELGLSKRALPRSLRWNIFYALITARSIPRR